MAGNINVFGIIITVLATALLLWKFGGKPKSRKQVIVGIVLPGLAFFFGAALSVHACDAGNAFTQLLIPAICLALIIVFVGNTKIRAIVGIIMFFAAAALTIHFNNLVHQNNYTGNPSRVKYWNQYWQEKDLNAVKQALSKEGETIQKKYPPDWVKAGVFYPFIPEDVKARLTAYLTGFRVWGGTFTLWHTYFTGLYGIRTSWTMNGNGMAIWYPGGTLTECADKLEFRQMKIIPIIRQCIIAESDISENEYYLFTRQSEIDEFLLKKQAEIKHPLPLVDTPKIAPDEMCFIVSCGQMPHSGLYVDDLIEEPDRISIRVIMPWSFQTWARMERDEKTGEEKVVESSGAPKAVTPFGYFIIPKTNKRIVIQNDLPPHELGEPNWQDVKEFNPK